MACFGHLRKMWFRPSLRASEKAISLLDFDVFVVLQRGRGNVSLCPERQKWVPFPSFFWELGRVLSCSLVGVLLWEMEHTGYSFRRPEQGSRPILLLQNRISCCFQEWLASCRGRRGRGLLGYEALLFSLSHAHPLLPRGVHLIQLPASLPRGSLLKEMKRGLSFGMTRQKHTNNTLQQFVSNGLLISKRLPMTTCWRLLVQYQIINKSTSALNIIIITTLLFYYL